MRTLLFQNNVHNTEKVEIPGSEPRAVNLTVRKGLKWSDLKVGEIVELRATKGPPPLMVTSCSGNGGTIYDVKIMPFNALMNYPRMLKLEHDPKCQNYAGLFETMRKVYDGFLQHELVTLVFYEVVKCKCPDCVCPDPQPNGTESKTRP